jgi:hypothetical protein
VFRQSDAEFIAILNKFRLGICDEGAAEFIKGCGSALDELSNKIKVSQGSNERFAGLLAYLVAVIILSRPIST